MSRVYEIGSLSDQGMLRENNEDSVIVLELSCYLGGVESRDALLVLGDGVGGGPAGQVASRTGVTSFIKNFLSHFLDRDASDVPKIIEESFQEAHRDIIDVSKKNRSYSGMATTLTVVFVDNHKCYIGHIGNSRCYLIRKGRIEQLTVDQSIGRFLQQALGAQVALSIFKTILNLEVNDYVMICSDGLTDLVDNNTILDIVSQDKSVANICTNLVDEANSKGGNDNISVALLKVLE